MNFSIIQGTTLLALAAAIAFPAATEAADDRKVNSAMSCQPYRSTTDQTDLAYRPAGVTNIRDTDEYVVCSISVDVDEFGTWTPDNNGQVNVIMHNPGGEVPNCKLFMGSNLTGTTKVDSANLYQYSGEIWTANLFLDNDGVAQIGQPSPPITLYCKLPPSATLTRVWQNENAETDKPDPIL
ncbi:hypothetical protein GCM10011521_01160 [Arenimonas soli]|uniref:Uncharacterized protein n=1 Tax=Arenimonas soli TaxID=2269504 RepID=A0ABQ1HAF7_9GAMM|nr:hypothetical protein [Arenimonas soli]GGA66814.1 hypothetical protein GCM10011521_01160 [Arenimonas soli]